MQKYEKHINWGKEAESFSRTVVDEVAGVLDNCLCEVGEGRAFFEKLPQESVGVFYGTLFP